MEKTLIELANEAKELGIVLTNQESPKELKILIEEKKKETEDLDPKEVIRIKEEGKIAEAKLKQSQQRSNDEKKYSEVDLREMFDKFKKDDEEKLAAENDPDKPIIRLVTIPRFDNKFIVGFANLNKDPYFPDKIITSQNIFNDQTKVFVPHVMVIFEDDTKQKESRLLLPFETILKVSNKIECKIIERRQKDVSEKLGMIAVEDVSPTKQGYNRSLTGEIIQGKQKKFAETFLIETPDGRQILVSPEVVNWKPVQQKG